MLPPCPHAETAAADAAADSKDAGNSSASLTHPSIFGAFVTFMMMMGGHQ